MVSPMLLLYSRRIISYVKYIFTIPHLYTNCKDNIMVFLYISKAFYFQVIPLLHYIIFSIFVKAFNNILIAYCFY